MARKSNNVPIDLDALANTPGVVSLTVDGKPYKPRRRIGPVGTLTPDPRAVRRLEAFDSSIFITLPLKTKNPTNNLEHWRTRSRRCNAEHAAVADAMAAHAMKFPVLARGCVVTLTRISAGRLDPMDGLPPALKAVKDAVAMAIWGGTRGQKDDHDLVEWKYDQRSMGRGVHAVTIKIEPRGTA